MEVTPITPEPKAKMLYDILSETEKERIKDTEIRNCRFPDITISELMHLRFCIDCKPNMKVEDVLTEIIKRAA